MTATLQPDTRLPPTPARPATAAAVLAALPSGVALAGADGDLLPLNDPARALLRAGTDTVRNALAAPADGPDTARRIQLPSGARVRIERRPLGDSGTVVLFTDVTREQRLDDALARHQRLAALGELAATLAHQVRTPLAAALLYVGNAALPAIDTTQRLALLDRAAACLRDLEELVDGMLGFARGAATGPRPTRVADVLAAVTLAAEPACRPGQRVAIGVAEPDVCVAIGREALAGALLNLVQNALQAAGPAAHVDITVTATAGDVTVVVEDNGPGIPPALRERVREPFFTTRAEGTGLGLAVVDALARAAGGVLAIDTARRTGARISLTLPRIAAVPLAAPTGTSTP